MPRVVLSAIETTGVREKGISKCGRNNGVRIRKYKTRQSCFRQGIEVSAEVSTLGEFICLLDQLFELAGIDIATKKRP